MEQTLATEKTFAAWTAPSRLSVQVRHPVTSTARARSIGSANFAAQSLSTTASEQPTSATGVTTSTLVMWSVTAMAMTVLSVSLTLLLRRTVARVGSSLSVVASAAPRIWKSSPRRMSGGKSWSRLRTYPGLSSLKMPIRELDKHLMPQLQLLKSSAPPSSFRCLISSLSPTKSRWSNTGCLTEHNPSLSSLKRKLSIN